MAKGYWVAQVDVSDTDAYKLYIAANPGPIGAFGGRYIVRNGKHVDVEGSMRPRIVVIEFPSYDAALACYQSPEYQSIRSLRTNVAECDNHCYRGVRGLIVSGRAELHTPDNKRGPYGPLRRRAG